LYAKPFNKDGGRKMLVERILVVDDDPDIAELIKIHLKREGYTIHITTNAEEALRILQQHTFEAIILDIMMPGMDGFELISEIRKTIDVPVIFLSARGDEPDKILGLGLGADDYITKPFSARELVARVKSNIRRYKSLSQTKASHTNEQATYKYGDLEINTNSRSVLCANKNVELTKTEFDILLLLASKPNQVFTFEQIYTQVWDEEYLGNSNTVMVHIKRLRNKLGDNTKNPSYIKTIWGVGYKFIE
jgi:DNA-binding response OmpR family regulator